MRFDGILFDLDGTLWDSCQRVWESWCDTLCRRFGAVELPTPQDVAGIMGLTVEGIADRVFAAYGDRRMEVCTACLNDEPAYLSRHGGRIYPGVPELLEKCSREARLFVVRNCLDGYIQSFYTSSGLGKYFTDQECEGSTGLGKADNIRLLVERYGLKAPVYVGDTATDERSAGEAGCPFVHVTYGFGTARGPLAAADTPEELAELLNTL